MLLVADNLQLTHPTLAQEIAARDEAALRTRVTHLVAAGAEAIDINTGPLGKQAEDTMRFCLEAVCAATDRPLLIDTVNAQAIRAALTAGVPNRLIINGFSLEPARLETILPLAVEFDTAIVGYLLDDRSQVPATLEEKLEIGLALFQHALAAGLKPEQLIVDPVVAPLSWQDAAAHNRALIEVLRRLPEMLGCEVQTIASLSNLTTGPTDRAWKQKMEATFVPMLAASGLSMLLVNMDHHHSVRMVRRSAWLLNAGVFSWAQVADLDKHTVDRGRRESAGSPSMNK